MKAFSIGILFSIFPTWAQVAASALQRVIHEAVGVTGAGWLCACVVWAVIETYQFSSPDLEARYPPQSGASLPKMPESKHC